MKPPNELQGTVTDFQHGCYRIDCHTIIEHLKAIFVSSAQAGSLNIGDSVTVQYRTGPSYGLWFVSEVNGQERVQ